MNARMLKSLVLGFAFAVVALAGSAGSSSAQVVCDMYGCYNAGPVYGGVPAPVYGAPAPIYGGGCDPYTGICYGAVPAPVYQPAYIPICDPFTGVCV